VKREKDEPEWVEAASVGDDEEAILIAGYLESRDIPAVVEGPSNTPFPEDIGAFGMSRVMVPPDRAEEARRLIEERKHRGPRRVGEESEAEDE
jgi:Putative prokaryotic signal transducing protein